MGWVVAITLVLALALSVPVGIALGLSAMAGLLYVSSDFLIVLPQKFLAGLDSFPLLAIPLFVLAGTLMSQGGFAQRIVDLALVFVGRIRGGLGLMVIFSTMLFSGISGSPSANTAAIGSVALPEMMRKKYPAPFATAIFAAAGGVSTLVPPAIDLIIIGVVANVSIGGLFAAGIVPAVVNGLAIMALASYFARKMDLPIEPRVPLGEKLRTIGRGVLPILMVVIILGGIYGGIFTPTEASAVAVVYGFIVSFFVYKDLTLADLPKVLLQTCSLTGVVLLVLGTASLFSFTLTFERIPHLLADLITEYAFNWIVFVLLVHAVFLILGMIMDALPPIIVLMPILVPAGVAFGMEPIHLGILVAANVGIGMISPPVGICLFVSCGISGTRIEDVVRPLIPFLAVLVITLLLISYVPVITLFLPTLFGYVGQ